MQENEFEKQVKQMMDEFKLQPSDEMWPKIDRRINGDKRKKRPFILLLVSCLLVSGFIMYRYEVTTADHAAKNNAKEAAIHVNKRNALKDSNTVITNTDAQANKTDTASLIYAERNKKINIGSVYHTRAYSSRTSNNVVDRKENQSLEITTNQQNPDQIHQQEVEQSTTQKEEALTATANTVDNDAEIKQQQHQNKDSSTAIANNNVAKADVGNNNILNNDSSASTQHNTNSKKISADTKTKLPDLQWGVTAFFGGSNAVNNLAGSNKSLPSSLNSGGGNFDTAFSNKPYTASTAYHIGFVVEKRIIKNGFIGTGLNYVHLSTKSTVGKSIDSTLQLPSAYSINNFYQSGTTSTYTNHYNSIELPVYFKQDLFPSKKIGLSYNAGFSIRQMISSNSLVYDPSYNIYFSKDDAINKTQFQLLAGFGLKINSSKNTSLYIGPQFSYSFSSLFKNNSGNFHLIDYGVHASFLLHKK